MSWGPLTRVLGDTAETNNSQTFRNPFPYFLSGGAGEIILHTVNSTSPRDTWFPGLQNLGAETGFRPRKSTSSYFLLNGVCRYCAFSVKTKHPVLTRPISNPQNPFSTPKLWSPGGSPTHGAPACRCGPLVRPAHPTDTCTITLCVRTSTCAHAFLERRNAPSCV